MVKHASLAKVCFITSLSLISSASLASEKSIAELVDAVNGTLDDASREAGKQVKLRNHAKGFCTSGSFIPAAELQQQLDIPFFNQGPIKVTARFSLGGTNANLSDKTPGRFMSLKIDGEKESLNFVTTNVPIFFASNLDDFYSFQTKIKEGPQGKQWLKDNKPDAKRFLDYVAQLPPSPSFANSRYFGVNSFYFRQSQSDKTAEPIAGKWIFEPLAGTAALSKDELAKMDDNFLKAELLTRIETQAAEWELYIQLAEASDIINDPTVSWPDSRPRLLAGKLVIDGKRDSAPEVSQCGDGIFNPVLLPKGITPSADPILNARTPAYIESFIRRR
ncbi:catalase family peroxidase [Shewanella sp. FJAT-52076]|uniref:catalase family peroxidase n=1 Tax=Shewanella sp. FJAT-52076 TaxID=2864202 RepID=UPI001C659DB8|nr:catalase family peroxidase [Shewanella sp. FJAT-52076]QYJ76120.1 catalase family peroxidase [Shewanella sp. FJAT-52076]